MSDDCSGQRLAIPASLESGHQLLHEVRKRLSRVVCLGNEHLIAPMTQHLPNHRVWTIRKNVRLRHCGRQAGAALMNPVQGQDSRQRETVGFQ